MSVKNPKNKGNEFERKVAKMLSEWAGVKFMRTPSSGAIHNFNDKRVVSDIVPPLSVGEFPFSIECKNVECSWEWNTLIDGTSQTINKHWDQCKDDAAREGLVPLLIVTKNFRSIYGIVEEHIWLKIYVDTMVNVSTVTFNNTGNESLVFFKLEDLLNNVPIDKLVSLKLIEH